MCITKFWPTSVLALLACFAPAVQASWRRQVEVATAVVTTVAGQGGKNSTASTASTAPSASPADAPPPPPAPWNATGDQIALLEPVDAPLGAPFSSHVTRRLRQINLSPGANLQTEVTNANAGDELILADGTYTGVGTSQAGSNMLYIDKDITIRALNPGQAVLDGEETRRVIYVASGTVVLEGLVITKGFAGLVRTHLACVLHPLGGSAILESPACLLLELPSFGCPFVNLSPSSEHTFLTPLNIPAYYANSKAPMRSSLIALTLAGRRHVHHWVKHAGHRDRF